MGDLIMTTPVFSELKRHYPNSIVIAVVQHRNRELLITNPHVDHIFSPVSIKDASWFRGLRREVALLKLYRKSLCSEPIDITINPRLGPDYYGADFLMKLVGSPVGLRFRDGWTRGPAALLNQFAFRFVKNLAHPQAQHEVISNLGIIQSLTGSASTGTPRIYLRQEDLLYAKRILRNTQDLVRIVLTFGSLAKRRAWPLDRWAQTVKLIAEWTKIVVVIVCSADDEEYALELKSLIGGSTRQVCGATLLQAAAVFEQCSLFLGNDTGLAHLAAAVGMPTIVVSPHPLSGEPDHENSPIRFRPWSRRVSVIQPLTGLSPCSAGCEAIEAHCILQVSAKAVAEQSIAMLSTGDVLY